MNTILSKVLIFAAGAAIGSVVTYKLVEKKFKDEYEQRLAEDTASIKEAFSDVNYNVAEETVEAVIEDETPKDIMPTDLRTIVQRLDYIAEDSVGNSKEERPINMEDVERPVVIDPRDFAEYPDYDTETLYYYTDDVLADDMDNVVEDIEDIVGSYALTTFGMYEDDAVHVRNDAKRRYYEILRSECEYSEKYGQNLYRKED